ncbi:MAG: hypothetical protein JO297_18095 [Nitrososphaeraceae archaeon]|nr:hypothetical protein [Nitrososphaeraceae archaeon]
MNLTRRISIVAVASAFIAIALIVASPVILNSNSSAISNNYNGKSNNTNATGSSLFSTKKCNQSLWNFIANPPGRFKIINQCVTVTGTVLSINREPDGDTDFPLLLDVPYKNMVTKANFNALMQGGIWCEMICQHPEMSSEIEPFKRGECNGFNGRLIFNPPPQVGQHLMVTGTYLLDVREGGHAEIHPVSSIQLIN